LTVDEYYYVMNLTHNETTSFLPSAVHYKIDVLISKMETTIDDKITLVLENAFHVSEFVILIATVPVLVFYFLKDRYMMLRWLNSLLPKTLRERYDRMLFAIDQSLVNYIRVQLLLSITVALVTYAIYQILGLKFALLLAIFMGLMNVIPYFGPIIGSIPALAITATVSYKLAISVVIANAFVQL